MKAEAMLSLATHEKTLRFLLIGQKKLLFLNHITAGLNSGKKRLKMKKEQQQAHSELMVELITDSIKFYDSKLYSELRQAEIVDKSENTNFQKNSLIKYFRFC